MNTKYYKIAVRKKINSEDFFLNEKNYSFSIIDFNTSKRYWMADPFLFEKDGITYIFYELFDFIKWKGILAYSILNDNNIASKPKIIIEEPYHLSFPFIFEKKDQIYIMPETCECGDVHLYKAVKFPDIWVKDDILIQSIFSCDTIKIDNNNESFLLSSCMSKSSDFPFVISCYVNNVIFNLNEYDENFGCINGISVSKGDFGIRNAGASFKNDGNLIRPGQDSREGLYGAGLVFYKIDSLNPYKEEILYNVKATDLQHHLINYSGVALYGCHTYNSSSKYEVIDISYVGRLPLAYILIRFIYKKVCFVKRVLKRVFRKL